MSTTVNKPFKRMLINATHSEEIRAAIVNGDRLENIDVEHPSNELKKSNIYLATIGRVEPSLEAVFVNYGANRHGFLPLKEIEPSYFLSKTNDPRTDIKKILKEGQELLIQVDKEERDNKGAALTTYISLAGCYLVLMPNNPKAGGISKRIEGDDRDESKEALNSLTIPTDMGVIIRTAGLGKKINDLQWDLDVLLHNWSAIKDAAKNLKAPCLLHQESNIIIRTIRDNLRPDIKEILIDDENVYNQAKKYMELLRTDSKNIVKHYVNSIPLFTKFHIESQIEQAYQHEMRLPSGGSIVVDRTEALTAIDINSAQSTKGQNIENTALNTNLEAATEIARQSRLRDIGGLIVIDFIDMSYIKNQREVENKLREELQNDRAKIQLGRISKFGLLEMSRQRLKSSLGESTQTVCTKCSGKGSLRTVESLSLSLLRIIEEESLKRNTAEVQAQLPFELCAFLTNEKRQNILEIEQRHNVRIILIPNPHYVFPHYTIDRIKSDSSGGSQQIKSYNNIDKPRTESYVSPTKQTIPDQEVAAVKPVGLDSRNLVQNNRPNLLKRLWGSLFNSTEEPAEIKRSPKRYNKSHDRNRSSNNRYSNRSNKPHRNDSSDRSDRPQRTNRSTSSNDDNVKQDNTNTSRNNKQHKNANARGQHNTNPNRRKPRTDYKNTRGRHHGVRKNAPSELNQDMPIINSVDSTQKTNTTANINTEKQHDINIKNNQVKHNQPASNVINNNKAITAEPRNKVIEKSVANPVIQVTVEPVIEPVKDEIKTFKKNSGITKINRNDAMTKRRFYPRKKPRYETKKHNTANDTKNDTADRNSIITENAAIPAEIIVEKEDK